MKKESSTNLQKYSGIAEQMVKMSSDRPEITKIILDIIYGDEGEGNGISTISQTAQRLRNPGQKRLRKASTDGPGYTPDIDPDKEEHNLSETEKYFQRWTKRNNNGKD